MVIKLICAKTQYVKFKHYSKGKMNSFLDATVYSWTVRAGFHGDYMTLLKKRY